MNAIFLLGLLIGMKHAIESDHVAAVASLASRARSVRETVKVGVVWGLGHTLTLLLIGSVVLAAGGIVPEQAAEALEFAVGIMLVILGLDVVFRLLRERVHVHAHGHVDGTRHLHAHAHRDVGTHEPERHAHPHPQGFPLRALLVGLVHGMAGSAALILLTLETIESVRLGLLYIAMFGLGSVLGMALLSAAIAVPLRFSARRAAGVYNGLRAGIGTLTFVLGVSIMYRIGAPALLAS
ncbi:MAG: urease accessory protein [Gammaproteobacteria bacterium]